MPEEKETEIKVQKVDAIPKDTETFLGEYVPKKLKQAFAEAMHERVHISLTIKGKFEQLVLSTDEERDIDKIQAAISMLQSAAFNFGVHARESLGYYDKES